MKEGDEKEQEIPLILPLALSGLTTAMKIRCADLCLHLLQQFSDLKNSVDTDRDGRTLRGHTENSEGEVTVPLTVITLSSTHPALSSDPPTPTPTAPASPLPVPLDASLPQAVCQLLAHITRDSGVRDHFESIGGVHQLITTIPPFEGTFLSLSCCVYILTLTLCSLTHYSSPLYPVVPLPPHRPHRPLLRPR